MVAPVSAVSSSSLVSTALVRLGAAPPPAASPELLKLQVQHEKLLGQVEKKRQVVDRAADEARLEEERLASEVDRLQEQIRSARDEIRAVFEFLVGAQSHLPKKERNKVRRLMRELFDDDDPEPDDDDQDSDSIDSAERNPKGNAGGREPRQAEEASRERGPRPAPQVRSASRPDAPPQLLRSLFKRLALALHPDRVQSEPERQARTRQMQEVTAAYGRGDLAALLAIEKRWMPASQPAASGDPREWVQRLRQANAELRAQLKSLGDQLKELAQDPQPKTDAKRSKGTSVNPVVRQLSEVCFEAERLLAVARAFRAREISVTQFISAHYRRSAR